MPAAKADHQASPQPGTPRSRPPTRHAAAAARWTLSTITTALVAIWAAGQWYTAILRTPARESGWFAAAGIGQGAFVFGWTTKPELARHAGTAQLAPSGAADHWLPRFAHSPAGVQIIAPVWLLNLATGAPAAWLWARHLRRRRWARAGRCPACGYPLPPDAAQAACPECGRSAGRSPEPTDAHILPRCGTPSHRPRLLPLPSPVTEQSGPFSLDRRAFSVSDLDQQGDDAAYWITRSIQERMAALEYLRRMAYGEAATGARLQRVLSVAQLRER